MEKSGVKIAAQNRKAYHDYFVEDRYEAGIELFGTEVKSIRAGTHKREIRKLHDLQKQEGYALIPLSVYFKNSRVKVELGLCKGKKTYDKRDAVAKRDAKREMDRAMREKNRGY